MRSTLSRLVVLLFSGVAMFSACPAWAGQTNGVVIVVGDPIPEGLSRHLAGSLPENLFCPVRIQSVQLDRQESAATEIARQARGVLTAADVGCVVLVARPGELTFRDYLDLTGRVAVLNVAPLMPDVDGAVEGDLFNWRVEKQVTRAAALLAGLSSCPFPLCGLSESRTLKDVDVKGRNLCPPCQIRLEERMHKAGLYLVPTNEPVIRFPEDK